ncbi:MAG: hypothetical protein IT288_15540 [Bdellovibrionales bacterium]|nr:hypothetical protein [Bdellovibrionales bacterium]
MNMLCDRLNKAFELYNELVAHLNETSFGSKLAELPSNTIGEQLWCVVGARESYLRGIQKGQWDGFRCSLTKEDIRKKKSVADALLKSSQTAEQVLNQLESLLPAQEKLAFELLEHEIQHQGQLIRYLYGLKLGIPAGLKARYHLD